MIQDIKDGTKIMIEGDIDLYNADEFKRAISGLSGDVVLDCSALNYIDSTGLGVLGFGVSKGCKTGENIRFKAAFIQNI